MPVSSFKFAARRSPGCVFLALTITRFDRW